MPVDLGVVLQIYAATVSTVLVLACTALAWFLRTHVLSEVNKNSQFRQYAGGTGYNDDSGRLGDLATLSDDIDHLSDQMNSQHAETAEKLDYAIEYIRRTADAIEEDIQEPSRRWRADGQGDDDD